MRSNEPHVACILLNWNGWKDTSACLATLKILDYGNISIIVVDNGSTDESVTQIRNFWPEVLLIETGKNLGFAGGNNVGVRHALEAGCDYVWLLNNDTEPQPDSLAELVKKASANPRMGAVGSELVYTHDPSTVQAWGGGQVSLWTGRSSHARTPHPDEWFHYLTAASILLPRTALEDVGLLDDKFFLYWEDGDLSFRLRQRGWLLGVAGSSRVLHKEHASTGRNRRVIDRYVITSGIRFLSKHSPAPFISVPLFLSLRFFRRLLAGEFRRMGDIIGGIKDYFSSSGNR